VKAIDSPERLNLSPVVEPAVAAGHPMLDGSPDACRRLGELIEESLDTRAAAARRLWGYYRNEARPWDGPRPDGARPYQLAQEQGLPTRITARIAGDEPFDDTHAGILRKEVCIENDIAWRIDAGVDLLAGRPIVLDSAASDDARRDTIGGLIRRIWAGNGGLDFIRQLALTGAVCGGVDLVVKLLPDAATDAGCDTTPLGGGAGGRGEDDIDDLEHIASRIRFEAVEPAEVLAIHDAFDPTRLCVHARIQSMPSHVEKHGEADWIGRLWGRPVDPVERRVRLEVLGPLGWQVWEAGELVAAGPNTLGRLPVVHVQHHARPNDYDGAGEVAPLIPLQDELNTRLSDRAQRVVLQSQPMYLGVGVDGFGEQPVAPGRMWHSDNPDARIITFGGEATSPSEDAALGDLRDAMDKTSGVNPVAAGLIRGRVGNLTSAAALRLTFQTLLSRTERKRVTYGSAIARATELALALLDVAGLFPTDPSERRIKITWPDPIPADPAGELEQARLKQDLGVARDVVLRELGY
jgi:hypothetical protein